MQRAIKRDEYMYNFHKINKCRPGTSKKNSADKNVKKRNCALIYKHMRV